MQIVDRKISFKMARKQVEDALPTVFFERELRQRVKEDEAKYGFSERFRSRLMKSPALLPLEWNMPKKSGELFSFQPLDAITEFDILSAWTNEKGCYLSHYSALYFNDLIEQRPNDHFLTREISGKSPGKPTPLKPLSVKQAFLKPARSTQNFFEFDQHKFYLLEKVWLNSPGVFSKKFVSGSKEVEIRITTKERTFLDSVISPHYAGGLATVVKAFTGENLNVRSLEELYRRLNPVYPYWQNIGLLLEKMGLHDEAHTWEIAFKSDRKLPFFLEHEARSFWQRSDRWDVSYPGGVFGET